MTDEVIVDLTNYKDRVGTRVIPGRYRVVVEDAESDTSSAGNPMVNVWLRVASGEFEGATIIDRLVLTDKSMFRVVAFMMAIGMPTPKKRFKVNVRSFVGKVLDIDVEDGDPYNGRVKSEVRGYMRVSDRKSAAVAEEDLPGEDELSAFTGEAQAEAGQTEQGTIESKNGSEPAPEPTPAPEAAATESAEIEIDEIDLESLDLG